MYSTEYFPVEFTTSPMFKVLEGTAVFDMVLGRITIAVLHITYATDGS